ncbi:transglutaminase domain-containing protein [Microlunatus flavus]|uniref:Transglutaminase-like superfamily protein n=1 Tax=Microlunatus flavus TaxID=1036181 RepID=A0A1H9FTH8_9ACTN|nr:transglutaminase domain-containing protein [Microlunatus flavus]SEQ41230.1 Transglutaminase-like superfamily protein [Microlunatus flavus]
MIGGVPGPETFAEQSRYSAPGRHADRLAALPSDVASLCAASRNVIAHYRAELPDLAEERRHEIDSRWLEVILTVDQQRHPAGLDMPRPSGDRVAGCCRDHSLFVVGALRQRGVPARNRVGFAHYFTPVWASDHVVVELWREGRWQRADPELGRDPRFDVHDLPVGRAAPFETAAEAWLAWRAGDRDLSTYGVEADRAFSGPGFVWVSVVHEVAHRYGDEMLLWDGWGVTEEPLDTGLVDELAQLLVRADAGDDGAEAELWARYHEDDRLHPGSRILTHSPYGLPTRTTDLTAVPAAAEED